MFKKYVVWPIVPIWEEIYPVKKLGKIDYFTRIFMPTENWKISTAAVFRLSATLTQPIQSNGCTKCPSPYGVITRQSRSAQAMDTIVYSGASSFILWMPIVNIASFTPFISETRRREASTIEPIVDYLTYVQLEKGRIESIMLMINISRSKVRHHVVTRSWKDSRWRIRKRKKKNEKEEKIWGRQSSDGKGKYEKGNRVTARIHTGSKGTKWC